MYCTVHLSGYQLNVGLQMLTGFSDKLHRKVVHGFRVRLSRLHEVGEDGVEDLLREALPLLDDAGHDVHHVHLHLRRLLVTGRGEERSG